MYAYMWRCVCVRAVHCALACVQELDAKHYSSVLLHSATPIQISGGVLPEGKADFVSALRAGGKKVAMIGDGVNDAAALARADVGVAMGGGVGAASDAAAVVLMGDNLMQVNRMA